MHGITDDSGTTYQITGYTRDTDLVEAIESFKEGEDMGDSEVVKLAIRQLLQREGYHD